MPFQTAKSYDRDASKEEKYWNDNVSPYANPDGGKTSLGTSQMGGCNVKPNDLHTSTFQKPLLLLSQRIEIIFGRWVERIGKVFAKRMPDASRIVHETSFRRTT